MQAEVQDVTPKYLEFFLLFFFYFLQIFFSTISYTPPPSFLFNPLDKTTTFSQTYVIIVAFDHDIEHLWIFKGGGHLWEAKT